MDKVCPVMSGRLGYSNFDPYGSRRDDTPIYVDCMENCAWYVTEMAEDGKLRRGCAIVLGGKK